MDDEAKLLLKVQDTFKFDRMIVLGLRDEEEELQFLMSGNLSEQDAMLVLVDAMADLTITLTKPDFIH
jgi:hypothetical protein